jgi:hypothetical protein
MFKLFSARSPSPPETRAGQESSLGTPTRQPSSGMGGTTSRKQMLALVLRETLLRNGVPASWVGMEFFRTMDRAGSRTDGIHVRLVVRDGHPDLPARMLVLERDFRRRINLIDYRAVEWLQGVSWQFELPEEEQAAAAWAAPAAVRPVAAPAGAEEDGPLLISRGTRARQQDARGLTFASTEPAPL